jgi:hypothetical protein
MLSFGVQKILFPADDFHFPFHWKKLWSPLSHLTSCTPTRSNLYLANFLAAALSEPALYRLLTFHVPSKMSFCVMPALETLPSGGPSVGVFYLPIVCLQRKHLAWVILNIWIFHGEELLAPRPTPKLEDHPLSAVRDCLFSLLAATIHIGGLSSIHNLRAHHAVVTETHKHGCKPLEYKILFICMNLVCCRVYCLKRPLTLSFDVMSGDHIGSSVPSSHR